MVETTEPEIDLTNLTIRAYDLIQREGKPEDLYSEVNRWLIVGGFDRFGRPYMSDRTRGTEPWKKSSKGIFVKERTDPSPTCYAINPNGLNSAKDFLEKMGDTHRFELFTGHQKVMDIREGSYIDYRELSLEELRIVYDLITPKDERDFRD